MIQLIIMVVSEYGVGIFWFDCAFGIKIEIVSELACDSTVMNFY